MTTRLIHIIPACLLLTVTGCPDEEPIPAPDAAPAPDAPGAPPDASPPVPPDAPDAPGTVLPALSWEIPGLGSGLADVSCIGKRTRPSPGLETTFSLPVAPFGAPPDVAVPGARVQIFSDNTPQPDDQCALPGCVELLSDGEGQVTITLPSSAWFAVRALPLDGPDPNHTFLRTLDFNRTPPVPGGRMDYVHTISAAVMNALVEAAGTELSPGRGVVSGVALDCQGRPMLGGMLRFFGQDGDELDAAHVSYFDGRLPPGIDPTRAYSNRDGRYAVVNVPPADLARVELWGVPGDDDTDSDEPVLVACEEVGVHADSLSVLVLHPARSDGPQACGQDPL